MFFIPSGLKKMNHLRSPKVSKLTHLIINDLLSFLALGTRHRHYRYYGESYSKRKNYTSTGIPVRSRTSS